MVIDFLFVAFDFWCFFCW